jgi:serine protease
MSRRWITLALPGLLAALAAPAAAAAPAYVPGQVIVHFDRQRFSRAVELPDDLGVREGAAALRRNPHVRYAVPNYIATASAWIPNDPGTPPGRAGRRGRWVHKQWNFLPCGRLCDSGPPRPRFQSRGGINAIGAWGNLRRAGRAGAAGVTVAVLDTGIAYRTRDDLRRSPDFAPRQFTRGYDFVDGDAQPLDENGHGTHIAGTIAERTDNRIGVTGLAYRARLMPVRVLNDLGRGQADDIARGIRYAARRGADVINLSFNFACGAPVPGVDAAIGFAHRRGAVVVASIGNSTTETCVSPPATAPHAIGVTGTTEGACLGFYSLRGSDVDLSAPGGGAPGGACGSMASRPIFQVTYRPGSTTRFGLPGIYTGTSMSAAHVAGVAAMVIASKVVGADPPPRRVLNRLRSTARDLGSPGTDTAFGAGLIDAARATNPNMR